MEQEGNPFDDELMALFRQEALEHLLRLESQLLQSERSGQRADAGLAERMLADLHTLKGTARIGGKEALADLCHALESVVSADGFVAGNVQGAQFDALHDALKLARKLVERADGRTLNQARTCIARLEALALSLQAAAAAAPPAEHPLQERLADPTPPPPAPKPRSAREAHDAATQAAIRVPTRHLDLIRQHAEDMLRIELDLQRAAALLDDTDHVHANAAQLLQHCRQSARELEDLRHRFSLLRNGLLDSALESSMVPFSSALEHLPGSVRTLARAAGKQVQLQTQGEELAIDRRILQPVREMLVQLVTNAVDHGIELPAERRARGKAETGTVKIDIAASGADAVQVTVTDDGAGINWHAVAAAAGQPAGMDDAATRNEAQLTQLRQLIFRPGLSTAGTLTASSGRGVGLSLVADKLSALGGEAELDSAAGEGCRFRLRLPVRLARMLGLTVRVRQQRFVLPLAALKAVQALSPEQSHMVRNLGSLQWQDRVLPAIAVARALGLNAGSDKDDQHAVIVRGAAGVFALLVDKILEEQEVLPKTLGKQLRRVPGLAGATQLADGALAPILALDDLSRMQDAGRPAEPRPPSAAGPPRILVAEDSATTRLLLKHMLELAGYVVETASDGLQAWGRLRRARFDALVSDVSMPGLDGFQLCERVRADAEHGRLPVVLVTSMQSPAEKERGLHAGADAYFPKGAFDRDALLATLERLITTGVP